MRNDQNTKCHTIIHTAATATAGVGAGLAQIPGSDNAVIVPIQISMIMSLAGVFGISLTEAAAVKLIATTTATLGGRAISQFLVGWVPGIGNAINAATAFSITEAMGWSVANIFDCQTNT